MSRMPKVRARSTQYATWYEFKKDLERLLGYSLSNWRWIDVKPKEPLPWDDSHLNTTLSVLASHRKVKSRPGGDLRRQ
jgi:hypothetical protein